MNEPTNCVLQLYINSELKKLAKSSGLNLSKEFEQWIKIRLNQNDNEKPIVDVDLEIAKHRSEIEKLQSQAELTKSKEMVEKEKEMVLNNHIDYMIDDMKEHPTFTWNMELETTGIKGITFLFKKKFNIELNNLQAKEIILKNLKERGINIEGL